MRLSPTVLASLLLAQGTDAFSPILQLTQCGRLTPKSPTSSTSSTLSNWSTSSTSPSTSTTTRLFSEPTKPLPSKKVLTPDDIIARAKAQGTLPGVDDPDDEKPKLFSEEIYDDFQSALLKLEKRVKEGKGSLGEEEVKEFEEETKRIVGEMKEFLKDPEGWKKVIAEGYEKKENGEKEAAASSKAESSPSPSSPPPAAQAAPAPAQAPVASWENAALSSASASSFVAAAANMAANSTPANTVTSTTPSAPVAPETPIISNTPVAPVATVPPVAPAAPTTPATPTTTNAAAEPKPMKTDATSGYGVTDISDDEGPAYEGGYGLARGTTNTYVIPGMEEMSPEEYRKKLQESVSARQAQRRKDSLSSNRGIIGNRSSSGYLDGLSRGGGSSGSTQGEKHSVGDREEVVEIVNVVDAVDGLNELGNAEEGSVASVASVEARVIVDENDTFEAGEEVADGKQEMMVSETPQQTEQPMQNNADEQRLPSSQWQIQNEVRPEESTTLAQSSTLTKDQEDNQGEFPSNTREMKQQSLDHSVDDSEASTQPTQPKSKTIVELMKQSVREKEQERKNEWQNIGSGSALPTMGDHGEDNAGKNAVEHDEKPYASLGSIIKGMNETRASRSMRIISNEKNTTDEETTEGLEQDEKAGVSLASIVQSMNESRTSVSTPRNILKEQDPTTSPDGDMAAKIELDEKTVVSLASIIQAMNETTKGKSATRNISNQGNGARNSADDTNPALSEQDSKSEVTLASLIEAINSKLAPNSDPNQGDRNENSEEDDTTPISEQDETTDVSLAFLIKSMNETRKSKSTPRSNSSQMNSQKVWWEAHRERPIPSASPNEHITADGKDNTTFVIHPEAASRSKTGARPREDRKDWWVENRVRPVPVINAPESIDAFDEEMDDSSTKDDHPENDWEEHHASPVPTEPRAYLDTLSGDDNSLASSSQADETEVSVKPPQFSLKSLAVKGHWTKNKPIRTERKLVVNDPPRAVTTKNRPKGNPRAPELHTISSLVAKGHTAPDKSVRPPIKIKKDPSSTSLSFQSQMKKEKFHWNLDQSRPENYEKTTSTKNIDYFTEPDAPKGYGNIVIPEEDSLGMDEAVEGENKTDEDNSSDSDISLLLSQ